MWSSIAGLVIGALIGVLLFWWVVRGLWRFVASLGGPGAPLPEHARHQPFGALPEAGSVGSLGRLDPGSGLTGDSPEELLGPGS